MKFMAKDRSMLRVSRKFSRAPRILRPCNCLVQFPLPVLCRKVWAHTVCESIVPQLQDSLEHAGGDPSPQRLSVLVVSASKREETQVLFGCETSHPPSSFQLRRGRLREFGDLLREHSSTQGYTYSSSSSMTPAVPPLTSVCLLPSALLCTFQKFLHSYESCSENGAYHFIECHSIYLSRNCLGACDALMSFFLWCHWKAHPWMTWVHRHARLAHRNSFPIHPSLLA